MQGILQTGFRYLPLAVLALGWEAASRFNLIDSQALPPLTNVATAWVDLIRDGELVDNGAASLYRAFVGLFAGHRRRRRLGHIDGALAAPGHLYQPAG